MLTGKDGNGDDCGGGRYMMALMIDVMVQVEQVAVKTLIDKAGGGIFNVVVIDKSCCGEGEIGGKEMVKDKGGDGKGKYSGENFQGDEK